MDIPNRDVAFRSHFNINPIIERKNHEGFNEGNHFHI